MAEITFGLHFYGESWPDEPHTVEQCVTLSEDDRQRLHSFTPDALLQHLRSACIGRCNTVSGTDEYFIPRLRFGSLAASLQVNYYVWSYRDEQAFESGIRYDRRQSVHQPLITADEFDAVVKSPASVLDVAFYLDGRQISMGQMTIAEVSEFFVGLADDTHPTIEHRP